MVLSCVVYVDRMALPEGRRGPAASRVWEPRGRILSDLDTGPVEPDGPLGRQMVKSQVAPFGAGSVGEVAPEFPLAGDLAAEFAMRPPGGASGGGQRVAVP